MRENFSAFNGLRILAALGVVCLHYGTLTPGFAALPGFLQNVVSNGTIALPFFFLLSGFVLTHAYKDRLCSPQSVRSFYMARVARLYPVYLLSLLLFLPVATEKYLLHPAATQQHGARIFSLGGTLALGLIQSWTPLSQAWNGPAWSLSVEALFYLLFPWLMPRILLMRRSLLILGLVALWLCMIAMAQARERNLISAQFWHSYVGYQPLFWSPLFLMGIATYRLKSLWGQVPAALACALSAAVGILLIMLCGLAQQAGGIVVVNGGAAPLLALAVLAVSHPRISASRLLAGRSLTILGGASYVVYILQAPLWHIFERMSDHLSHADGTGRVANWQFLLYVPLLIGVSLAVQRVVERPAQQWLMGLREPRPTESNSRGHLVGAARESG